MIRKVNGMWHAYSESGRHFGGPYSTEAEAKHRIAQMEYFKHAKTASTYPLSRYLGAATGLKHKHYAQGLIGRRNTGGFLLPNEKALLPYTDSKDENSYSRAVLKTNPLIGAAEGASVGLLGQGLRKHYAPRLLKWSQGAVKTDLSKLREQFPAQGIAGERIQQFIPQFWKMLGIKGEPTATDIARFGNITPKHFLRAAGVLGLSSAGIVALHRLLYPRIVRGKTEVDKQTPESFIRTKLREDSFTKSGAVPLAALDDIAMWTARLALHVQKDSPEADVIKNLRKRTIKEDIKAIEKMAGKPSPILSDAWKAMLKSRDKKHDKSRHHIN